MSNSLNTHESIQEDFNLENVDIIFSNKGLWPWEGGCLWEEKDKKPVIQLRKVFKRKEFYLGLYSRREILLHEWVHAQRCGYREPIFEEILAYQTSPSSFRRYFGPLFRHSWEALIFLLASFSCFFSLYPLLVTAFFFLARLWWYQRIFLKSKKFFLENFSSHEAFMKLIKLKDQEILNIVKKSKII